MWRRRFDNPLYAEEMNILDFLKQPDVTIFQALLLKFKPVNMDVLPLYIVLLLLFPPVLWLLLRQPAFALAASALLYVLTWNFDWNLPAYPNGVWFFNPFAWQLLFVFGAWCALGGAKRLAPVLRSRTVARRRDRLSGVRLRHHADLVLRAARAATCRTGSSEWMYPIDKTNLDVLRFAHFLALAAVTVRFVPRDWPGLKSPILQPAILCGQHSLEIFCLGVFLAFAGHFVISEYSGGPLIQIAISFTGIIIMIGDSQPDIMVQGDRRAKPRIARQATGRRPRGRRGMSVILALVTTIALIDGAAAAAPTDRCDVPDSFFRRERAHQRHQRGQGASAPGYQRDRHRLLVAGRSRRRPLCLSGAARRGAAAAVTGHYGEGDRARPAARHDRRDGPGLGENPRRRQAVVGDLADRHRRRHQRRRPPKTSAPASMTASSAIENAGANVILMNMQYSPRTESMLDVSTLCRRHALGCTAT